MKNNATENDCSQQGRLVIRFTDQLKLHPALDELDWMDVVGELNEAQRSWQQFVSEPILITTNRTILAGFGRWRLAVLEGVREIECIEYPLSEDESLQFILAHHRTYHGWKAFVRIRLALTLEPYLQKKAMDNMRAGGKYKGSSNLTEAGKLDVRAEIAAAAGVSAGNVTKVKQLMRNATAEVLQTLRSGEISIHRAWLCSQEAPEKQRDALWRYQSEKGVKKTIHTLLRQQRPKDLPMVLSLADLTRRLSTLESSELDPVKVVPTETPGRTVFLSEELFRIIRITGE